MPFAISRSAEALSHPRPLQAELLRDHGRLYEITDFENERRMEWGLPPIQERADDVHCILVLSRVVEEAEP